MKQILISILFLQMFFIGFSQQQVIRKQAQGNVTVKANEKLGNGKTNDFTGKYEEGRFIYLEDDGEMYLQRTNFKLKLTKIDKDYYKMVYSIPVNNELPNVRFVRDSSGKVIGINFVFKDGRKDFKKKQN